MATTILIADDHPLLVDGLRRMLEETEGMRVLEPVGNGRKLLSCLRETAVDLVLLDLQMPQMDGLETLKVLRREFPDVKVLVYTNYHQTRLVQEARDLGANGYLSKSCTAHVLKEAIARIAAGGKWFDGEADLDMPVGKTDFTDEFMRKYQITSREVEILQKIAQGYTSRQIGEQLFLSSFTVNAHRRNICRKLDIHTPAGLVNFAREHRLV